MPKEMNTTDHSKKLDTIVKQFLVTFQRKGNVYLISACFAPAVYGTFIYVKRHHQGYHSPISVHSTSLRWLDTVGLQTI